MEGRVFFKQSAQVLKAATVLREEICGPLTQKVDHSHQFKDLTDEQIDARIAALTAQAGPPGGARQEGGPETSTAEPPASPESQP